MPFSVAYVYIPSVIKNYASKGASRLFYITLRERLVPNIALLNDVCLIEQWRLILYLKSEYHARDALRAWAQPGPVERPQEMADT